MPLRFYLKIENKASRSHSGLISFLSVLGFLTVFSCKERPGGIHTLNREQEIVQQHSIVPKDTIICHRDYCFWISPDVPESGDCALLLFFDPQGEGKRPIDLYSKAGFPGPGIFVGSNLSKNGLDFETSARIASSLLESMRIRFPKLVLHPYFFGFSGGAKVALYAATQIPAIEGVVYAGAPGISQPACPVLGFAGKGDLNFADLLAFDSELPSQLPHHLVVWSGKHEWPNPKSMKIAFDWIAGKLRPGSRIIDRIILQKKAFADSITSPLEKLSALHLASFLSLSTGKPDIFKTELEQLRLSPEFIKAKSKKDLAIQDELVLKDSYRKAFLEKDLQWWEPEIQLLSTHARFQDAWLQDRLLGYLSLLAYSASNQALVSNDLNLAAKFLAFYKLVHPLNSEHAYLLAVLQARKGDKLGSTESFKLAVKLGFNDSARVLKQPEFSGMGLESYLNP
jgi:pimeloyl-ACP methyl ester carboxylesterase